MQTVTNMMVTGKTEKRMALERTHMQTARRRLVMMVVTLIDIQYVGSWVNGVREGFGQYYYEDGSVYAGKFENDRPLGPGTMKFPHGCNQTGEVRVIYYDMIDSLLKYQLQVMMTTTRRRHA